MPEVDFYCKDCKLDQRLPAKIATFYGGGRKFVSRCRKCNKELWRLIDEKENDPFYYQSKNVIINRHKFKKELIQPGEAGFKMLYQKEWLKMEKDAEEAEQKHLLRKKERDKFYKEHSSNIVDKQFAKKVIALEEKLTNA